MQYENGAKKFYNFKIPLGLVEEGKVKIYSVEKVSAKISYGPTLKRLKIFLCLHPVIYFGRKIWYTMCMLKLIYSMYFGRKFWYVVYLTS